MIDSILLYLTSKRFYFILFYFKYNSQKIDYSRVGLIDAVWEYILDDTTSLSLVWAGLFMREYLILMELDSSRNDSRSEQCKMSHLPPMKMTHYHQTSYVPTKGASKKRIK